MESVIPSESDLAITTLSFLYFPCLISLSNGEIRFMLQSEESHVYVPCLMIYIQSTKLRDHDHNFFTYRVVSNMRAVSWRQLEGPFLPHRGTHKDFACYRTKTIASIDPSAIVTPCVVRYLSKKKLQRKGEGGQPYEKEDDNQTGDSKNREKKRKAKPTYTG